MMDALTKTQLRINSSVTSREQLLSPAGARARCDYKLLSAEHLPVGELHAILAQHRRDGWIVAHLLTDDDDQIAGIDDLMELGILLKRERSA